MSGPTFPRADIRVLPLAVGVLAMPEHLQDGERADAVDVERRAIAVAAHAGGFFLVDIAGIDPCVRCAGTERAYARLLRLATEVDVDALFLRGPLVGMEVLQELAAIVRAKVYRVRDGGTVDVTARADPLTGVDRSMSAV